MEEKKKSSMGLIVVLVVLLLICAGMGTFIFINKDKLITKGNTTTVKNENKNILSFFFTVDCLPLTVDR